MALTVEDGTGIQDADSYVSTADADTYWDNRQHTTFYTTWDAASTDEKEGALREATTHLDAIYGPYYIGIRRGRVQGLLWPRTGAHDDADYPLPDLPREIQDACCELAARAVSARLSEDVDRGGAVKRKREKIGEIEEETEFFDGATTHKRYGAVDGILAPLLTGAQPGSDGYSWHWR